MTRALSFHLDIRYFDALKYFLKWLQGQRPFVSASGTLSSERLPCRLPIHTHSRCLSKGCLFGLTLAFEIDQRQL